MYLGQSAVNGTNGFNGEIVNLNIFTRTFPEKFIDKMLLKGGPFEFPADLMNKL
jgi:hypothetical protein